MAKTIQVDKGDFVIIQPDKRKFLVESIGKRGRIFTGVVSDQSRADEATRIELEFDTSHILTNLGPNPRFGTAYGVRVEPWRKMREVKGWGKVHFFREVTDAEEAKIMGALKRMVKKVDAMGLGVNHDLEFHIRHKRGKWAGYYTYGGDKKPDTITYVPETVDKTTAADLVWHEDAHRIWARYFDHDLLARWIRLYHKYVEVGEHNLSDMFSLRDSFTASQQGVREYGKNLSDEEQECFYACIDWITSYQSMSVINIDILNHAKPDEVAKMWPIKALSLSDMETVISDYAMTKPEEFFAEAWAHYFTGRELPTLIRKAIEQTVTLIEGDINAEG